MAIIAQKITDLLKSVEQKIDQISKPNSKHVPDQIEHEAAHSKNRILIITQLIILTACVLDMQLNQDFSTTKIMRSLFLVGNCVVMIISCKYHPLIFNFYYIFVSVIYGPLIMGRGEDGIMRAWFFTLTLPLLFYVLTESWWGYLLQVMFHTTYINTIYQPAMEKSLLFLTSGEFQRLLTHSTNASIIFHVTITLITHYFMRKSYQKMATIQKKKDEVENQKVFLLGFSHELRNLINSLTGNVTLAGFENMTQKGKELLSNAEVCGELLLHLVNNILDTGKVEIGELEINPAPTRIYDVLEKIWGVCAELIKRRKLKGQIRIPRDLPKDLIIDHYRLTQIFLNLVGNAVKFTETGLIDINVEWIDLSGEQDQSFFRPYPFNFFDDYDEGLFEKKKHLGNLDKNIITLNLYTRKINTCLLRQPASNATNGVLKVSISDTGCGMSSDEKDKLFQKFSQVTSDPSKKQLGTGLGLFITKQLCQKMQGDVRAYSQKNNGSSFIFCIPVKVAVISKEVGHLQDLESLKKFIAAQNLKAMIVDDIPFNCSILKSFFDKLGIQVVEIAQNGLEAYQKYLQYVEKGERLDVVTMDLDMPVMSGKESARRIRRIEVEKRLKPCFLPIISGNCSESEISECVSKNGNIRADDFLKKPATLDGLLRAIGAYFHQLEDE